MRVACAALSILLMLSACGDPKPEGQVIASVNGEEITRQEFNAIIARANLDPGADKAALQNAVLDQMIGQRLVVQAARSDKLDKSQQFILQSRAADDAILTKLFAQKVAGAATTPYDSDVTRYMAANPTRFSQRTLFGLDQLRVPVAKVKPEWLKDANSVDDLARTLTAQHVDFQRGAAGLDSASLSTENFRQVDQIGIGKPFSVAQGDLLLVSAVLEKKLAPIDPGIARDLATRMLQEDTNRATLNNRIAALRKTAKIQYQTGFGPPKVKN